MRSVFEIQIDLEKSHGSWVHDKFSGKEFLDLHCMYSSLPLGYNHPIFDESFLREVQKIAKTRVAIKVFRLSELNSFTTHLKKYIPYDHTHLTCTGSQAVEAAIKCALEYKKNPDAMVIGVKNSFHGISSWGFLTDRVYPTNERMRYFPRNAWPNLELDEIIERVSGPNTSDIAAVLIEPIQCTAGDIYLDPKKLKEINEICRKKDICFIVDEIQTGFGVTGKMWYSDQIGLKPDVLVYGKKAQVCGIAMNEKYSECLSSHYYKLEVTFDGELLDIVRSDYVLKAYEKYGLLERVSKNSSRFRELLAHRTLNYRSLGHLIAFDFDSKELRDSFVGNCLERGVLCNKAGDKTVRLRPSLAITDDEIDFFEKVIKE